MAFPRYGTLLLSVLVGTAAVVEKTERDERLTLEQLEKEPHLSRITALREKLTAHLQPRATIPVLYSDLFSLHRWLHRYQGHKEIRLLDDFKEATKQLGQLGLSDPQVRTMEEAVAELKLRYPSKNSAKVTRMVFSKEGDVVHLSKPPELDAGIEFNLVKFAMIYKVGSLLSFF